MNIHIHHFHSKGAVADQAALEQFQKQWATYQKLVDGDALAHREVGTILRALAALAKPFAFLDIACGDAGQMKQALSGTKASHYHGIDLSEPALELAAKNLEGVPSRWSWTIAISSRPSPSGRSPPTPPGAGFRSITSRPTASAICSKRSAARHQRSSLTIYRAQTRLDGESRDDYLARFRRVNCPAWPFLSDESGRRSIIT